MEHSPRHQPCEIYRRDWSKLHGQHEHPALLDPLAHLPLLDDYADAGEVATEVAAVWTRLRSLRDELERSRMDEREKMRGSI
jgi:DNA repair ATPase RecN